MNVNKVKMEFEILGVRRWLIWCWEVFIVVFLVVFFLVVVFFIGYFVMKVEKNIVICCLGDGRDGNGKKLNEKYYDMF